MAEPVIQLGDGEMLGLLKSFAALAIRMRRAQVESDGRYHAAAWARKKSLEEHFDQHAREIFGDAGEVRQPGAVRRPA